MIGLSSLFSLGKSAWSWVTGGGSAVYYLAGGLVLAVLLGWLFWSRASLKADLIQERADRIAVQNAYDAKSAAFTELQAVTAATVKALADRDKQISQITAQSRVWQRKWQEAVRNDKETRDWAGTGLPASVRELLQQ